MRRRRICGFEGGTTYAEVATDGNVVVDTTSKRSGLYGLHVTGVSGVKSSLKIESNFPSVTINAFTRWYQKFVTIPSTARLFTIFGAVSPSVSTIELRINTNGTISALQNGSLLGTSSIPLVDARFYMLEIGIGDDGFIKFRIDGNDQFGWITSGGAKSPSGMDMFVGAMDTVAAAMEFYVDDYETDIMVFPGNGRVERIGVTTLHTDNADWSLVGAADKAAAVNEDPPFDDDTGYILSSIASSNIIFNVEGKPSAAKVIRGIQWHVRAKRDGASNGILQLIPSAYNNVYTKTVPATSVSVSTASYVDYDFGAFVDDTPMGAFYSDDDMADLQITLRSASANDSRVTAVWGEMGYDDASNATQDSLPIVVSTMADGPTDLLAMSGPAPTGTVARDTIITKENGDSIKITHAAGGASRCGFTIPGSAAAGVWWGNSPEGYFGIWVYVDTLPTSGNMGLFYFESGGFFRGLEVLVGSNGSINTHARTSGLGTATAAGKITAGQWYFVTTYIRMDTNTTNGIVKVWIDDVLTLTRTAVDMGMSNWNVRVFLGTATNVAGGGVVYYDNMFIDLSVRHTQHVHFDFIQPTAAGSLTQASFTATGAANKWDCLDEIPDNDDTDYVLVPAGTTLTESYELDNIDSLASTIYGFQIYAVGKRDGATNGSVKISIVDDKDGRAIPASTRTATFATVAAKGAASASFLVGERSGRLEADVMNAIELALSQNSANPSRITALYATVLYTRTNPRGTSRGSHVQVTS